MMRVIITGATGQLGQALQKVLAQYDFDILDVPRFDVKDYSVVRKISDLYPDLVIHTAAMTDVDGCARDPDLAFSINAFGTQNVAHACLRCNAEMICISTNEVFNGRSDQPYHENDQPSPINPYGSSKRAGEQMAAHYLKSGLYIVRTAWLYGYGNKPMFPEKIIAAADKRGELRVVTDEISNPTYVLDLAEAIAKLIQTHTYGTYHFTNSGYCSRFEFAKEILRLSGREHIPIHPITLAEYQRASQVPPFAPLVNTRGADLGIKLRPWQEALVAYFEAKH
jgi:dTDP-4-dehydrorhamnose reductase